MKKRMPWMKLYCEEWLADTSGLTSEETGALSKLLAHMWLSTTCSLENADRRLPRMAGVHPPNWKRIKAALIPFFQIEGDHSTNQRLRDQWRVAIPRERSIAHTPASEDRPVP